MLVKRLERGKRSTTPAYARTLQISDPRPDNSASVVRAPTWARPGATQEEGLGGVVCSPPNLPRRHCRAPNGRTAGQGLLAWKTSTPESAVGGSLCQPPRTSMSLNPVRSRSAVMSSAVRK